MGLNYFYIMGAILKKHVDGIFCLSFISEKQNPNVLCQNQYLAILLLCLAACLVNKQSTVKSRAEARVTIQEIKSLGVLQTETCH